VTSVTEAHFPPLPPCTLPARAKHGFCHYLWILSHAFPPGYAPMRYGKLVTPSGVLDCTFFPSFTGFRSTPFFYRSFRLTFAITKDFQYRISFVPPLRTSLLTKQTAHPLECGDVLLSARMLASFPPPLLIFITLSCLTISSSMPILPNLVPLAPFRLLT